MTKKPAMITTAINMLVVLVSGFIISLLLGPLVILRDLIRSLADWTFTFLWWSTKPFAGLAFLAWIGDIVIYGVAFLALYIITKRVFK